MAVIGEVLAGRYRLVELLGRGGMGEVFRAGDLLLGRDVAVKRIVQNADALDGGTQAVQRLYREARSAARIHHNNVVTVHDVLVEDNHAYIVMEYVAAPSLSTILRRDGRISYQRAAEVGAQVAGALAVAHRLGIVHRDVKPANILVQDGWQVKLADFGVARSEDDVEITQKGTLVGSVAFMAPEVARGGVAKEAADIFSLGATLFAAVEGHPPFAKEGEDVTAVGLLTRLVTETAPRAERGGPLEGPIVQMLAPAPDQRPSAQEVHQLLMPLVIQVTNGYREPVGVAEEVVARRGSPSEDCGTAHSIDDLDKTRVRVSRGADEADLPGDLVLSESEGVADEQTVLRPLPSAESTAAVAPPLGSTVSDNQSASDGQHSRSPRKPARMWLIAIASLLAVVVVSVFAGNVLTAERAAVSVDGVATSRESVLSMAAEFAKATPDVSDTALEYVPLVIETEIYSEVAQRLIAERKLTITADQRQRQISQDPALSALAENPVTADLIARRMDLVVAAEDESFGAELQTRLQAAQVVVDPEFGTWDRPTLSIKPPSMSASPTPS